MRLHYDFPGWASRRRSLIVTFFMRSVPTTQQVQSPDRSVSRCRCPFPDDRCRERLLEIGKNADEPSFEVGQRTRIASVGRPWLIYICCSSRQSNSAMSTEKEKMLAGELYEAADPELAEDRRRARDLLGRFNTSLDGQNKLRPNIYEELFGTVGTSLAVEPPFYCDYGFNIEIGDRVFFNFNCVVLDVARVRIGNDVLFGPAVQVYTATHPLDWRVRRQRLELARPVDIGSDVWVGGGAIIQPGVSIGGRSVIHAGAVVTKDVPEGVFAAGNPCRPLRGIE